MVERLHPFHVVRPELPWRKPEQALTECGLAVASYPTITRGEFLDRKKTWGYQRTMMSTCMTCYQTADRWQTWEEDPASGMQRAIERELRLDNNSPLRVELRGIALLIERHREEFSKLLAGLGEVVDLRQEREKRQRDGR